MDSEALKKRNLRVGKAMFAIKTPVEKEMLEQIREAAPPKQTWDTFAALFSEKKLYKSIVSREGVIICHTTPYDYNLVFPQDEDLMPPDFRIRSYC